MYNSAKVLLKGIKTDFAAGIKGAQDSQISPFMHTVTSKTDKESYLLFDVLGPIRELIDKISTADWKDFTYEIKNKPWYNATKVNKYTLEDSKGVVGTDLQIWINTLIKKWINFPDKLINALLTTNGNAFDATAFFANSRPNIEGSETIDNLISGSGITLANLNTDLGTVRQQLRGFKDRNGDPLNVGMGLTVYAPGQLETLFKQLQNSETVDLGSGAISNDKRATFNLVINDYQSQSNNDWYAINDNNAFKPFIWQNRQNPTFDNDDPNKIKGIHLDFWTEARSNAGYGNPTAIVKVDN